MKYLSIHLTDRCNHHCRFCVVSAPDHKRDVSLEEITTFLDSNREGGYQGVNLHGGEPTLHPDFDDIIESISAAGYDKITLQTNGWGLMDRALVKKLIDRGSIVFIISLHEANSVAHDRITNSPGSHQRLTAGILNVLELGGLVQTNTVLTRLNYHRLEKILAYGWKLGVRCFNISNIHPTGYALRNFEELVPLCSKQAPFVRQGVLNFSARGGAKITLEGFPYCTLSGLEHYHKKEEERKIRMLFRGWVFDDYETFIDSTCRILGAPCQNCIHASRCGGVYKEYIEHLGWNEFGMTSSPTGKEADR